MKVVNTLPARSQAEDASSAALHVAGRLKSAIADAVAALQRAGSERRMRDQLSTMDDCLLLDIGIERDEIVRVRNCERFTPRRWQQQIDASRPRRS